MKPKTLTIIIVVGVFLIILISTLLFSLVKSPTTIINQSKTSYTTQQLENQYTPLPFTIENDVVIVDDPRARLEVSPSHSFWPIINLTSKTYTGNVDFVIGFNSELVKPKSAFYYMPNGYQSTNETYTCEHEFNYTTNPKYFWCYVNGTYLNPFTNQTESRYQMVYKHYFDGGNLAGKTAWWSVTNYWKPLNADTFQEYDFDFEGNNKWYVKRNFSIEAGKSYVAQFKFQAKYVNVPPQKYWIGFKPTELSIQEAIAQDKFIMIDPWTSGLNDQLKAYYAFENRTTADAVYIESTQNASGNASAALMGDATFGAGVIGFAGYFDGAGDHGTINATYLPAKKIYPYTIATWVYLADVDQATVAASSSACSDNTKWGHFYYTTGADEFWMWRSSGAANDLYDILNVFDGSDIGRPAWTLIVAGVNQTDGFLYVNGSSHLWTHVNGTVTQGGTSYNISIGRMGECVGYYTSGRIDEVGIWNRTLTTDEIDQLWNSGSGITWAASTTDVYPGIVANSPANTTNSTVSSNDFSCTGTDDKLVQNVSLYVNGARNQTNSTPVNNTAVLWTISLANGNYRWYCDAYDNYTIPQRNMTQNYTLNVSFSDYVQTTLISPGNATNVTMHVNSSLAYANFTHNSTAYNMNFTNTTRYIWFSNGSLYNSSTIILSGNGTNQTIQNVSFAALGSYLWNARTCSDTPSCAINTYNWTFTVVAEPLITENSQTYNNATTESLTETFMINVSYNPLYYTSAVVYLNWNGTNYLATSNLSGSTSTFVRNVTIPQVSSDTMVNLNWTFYLYVNTSYYDTFVSTNKGQNISNIEVDNCTLYANQILNYTVFDEDDLDILPGVQNVTSRIYVTLSGDFGGTSYSYYSNFSNTNPTTICSSAALVAGHNYRLDAEIQYQADDYVTEYYYIQNYTLNTTVAPLQVYLYDLLTTRSQEFLILVKDENFIPLEDALIEITRQYLDLGSFITVEIPKTGFDGSTIGHFVLNDEVYTIYVIKNGELLATYENVKAFCSNIATGDCRITLNAAGSSTNPDSFINNKGVSYLGDYNDTSKTYTFQYTTTDSSIKTITLNVTRYDVNLNTSICSNSVISASGTVTCTIPAAYYNSTIIARVYVDNELLSSSIFEVTWSKISSFPGGLRYIIAFLVVVTLPLLAMSSGIMMLVLFIVGLIFAGSLALLDLGGFIGVASAFLWFIIAAIILIWKASRRGD